MPWTTPKTWNLGDILTAADMNTYVRDNTGALNALGAAGQPYMPGTTTPGTNSAKYSRVWLPAGTYTTFSIYISASAGSIDVGVFADSGGVPTTMLWHRGSASSPGTGFQDFAISAGTPTTLTIAAGIYWLGISGSSNSLQIGASSCLKRLGKTSNNHPLAASPTTNDGNDYPAAILVV